MKHLPTRKANRLNNYDYSQNGAYFITICTKKRAEFFGEITGDTAVGDAVHSVPHMHLSEYGIIAERILNTGGNSDVCLDTFVIMPNHVHMILIVLKRNPHKGNAGRCGQRPLHDTNDRRKSLISTFVRSFKTMTTKQIGFSLWQRSFHDHVIRTQEDYNRIAEYIVQNPSIWPEDCYNSPK